MEGLKEFDENICHPSSMEDFTNSSESSSSSSLDMVDDASSSSSSSSSFSKLSNGPLYEFSELMNHLPLKRGLSKYYNGKSQSFTSLAIVKGLEDLTKREKCYKKRMKPCKSYGWGLDEGHKKSYNPRATISKKSSKGSSLSSLSKKSTLMGNSRTPISAQKHF